MIAAIVQARMGSTRLPGKVMKPLCGKPILWHVVTRLKYSNRLENIVVATTDREEDKVIASLMEEMSVDIHFGSATDVLDRYYQTANTFKIDHIIRITADCPLIDPEILDKIVDYYLAHDYDYVSNTIKPTMPDGLDIEVINYKSLQRAWKEAMKLSEREHVTLYIYNHPELFKLFNYEHEPDLSGMRWVVDQEEDYKFITEVYNVLYSHDKLFYTKDVLSLLAKHPGLSDLNNSIKRNEGLLKSLSEDASE